MPSIFVLLSITIAPISPILMKNRDEIISPGKRSRTEKRMEAEETKKDKFFRGKKKGQTKRFDLGFSRFGIISEVHIKQGGQTQALRARSGPWGA